MRPYKPHIAQAKQRRRDRLQLVSFAIAMVLIVVFGSIFRDVLAGEIAIGLYGLAAITCRIPSSTTFKMAIISLVIVPLIAGLADDPELSETFAVYAFLLLSVGFVTVLLEQVRDRSEVFHKLQESWKKTLKSHRRPVE